MIYGDDSFYVEYFDFYLVIGDLLTRYVRIGFFGFVRRIELI